MAFNYDTLLNWKIPQITQELSSKDTLLYNLSVGIGLEPLEESELKYVLEEQLAPFPTMGVVLGYPGSWMDDPATGVEWLKVVHGEQGLEIIRPLPTSGRLVGISRVVGISDKGEGRGAVVLVERKIYDAICGDQICTVRQSIFCRGDGGCGGPSSDLPRLRRVPDEPPQRTVSIPTNLQSALLYRLNGDDNLLHVDPRVARTAGFPRPILHGLCTYAYAARAVLRQYADNRPEALLSMECRFTNVVFPGERLEVAMWVRSPGDIAFRMNAAERMVLDSGSIRLAA
jgi:acyl dehydratase